MILRTIYYALGIVALIICLACMLGKKRPGVDCYNCKELRSASPFWEKCCRKHPLGFFLRPKYCNMYNPKKRGDGDA